MRLTKDLQLSHAINFKKGEKTGFESIRRYGMRQQSNVSLQNAKTATIEAHWKQMLSAYQALRGPSYLESSFGFRCDATTGVSPANYTTVWLKNQAFLAQALHQPLPATCLPANNGQPP